MDSPVEYYFEIEFAPGNSAITKENLEILYSFVMQTFHGTLRRNKIKRIGISFPEWLAGTCSQSADIGRRFIFFSQDKNQLFRLHSLIDIDVYESIGVLVRSEIKRVPEHANRRKFSRCRRVERMLRMKKKGEWKEEDDMENREYKPMITVKRKHTHFFRLEISCCEDDSTGSEYNTYGLSSTELDSSAPIF